ncbi:MAG: RnfABCDGE type electron transport complex subunit G [Azoarcus sp.]|jgi:electron transport complex protein RnfG|nr:RnfABCDGE type electron transport complex subunit G [Azoarcus sp.]
MNTDTEARALEAARPPEPPSATRGALRASGILAAYALVFTALMSFAHQMTLPRILASIQETRMRLIDEVLPRTTYDNELLDDGVSVTGAAVSRVWRARLGNKPAALVFETSAPDGYGGRIELVVALNIDGSVSGARVTAHHETPGLGDYIDPKKDGDKKTPWITQFTGVQTATLTPAQWTTSKDGGVFAYRAGATISARAVTRAIGAALSWAGAHREALFAAPADARLDAEGNWQP